MVIQYNHRPKMIKAQFKGFNLKLETYFYKITLT